MTTPLQQAATELMDAMVKTDFTCRLGEQLDALEKALETEQAQAVEPIGYVRHADKTFWPHPECAVYASVSPSLAPVYAHPAPLAQLVTKPDSRPQNCGTGHCSCIECPYPKQKV